MSKNRRSLRACDAKSIMTQCAVQNDQIITVHYEQQPTTRLDMSPMCMLTYTRHASVPDRTLERHSHTHAHTQTHTFRHSAELPELSQQ